MVACACKPIIQEAGRKAQKLGVTLNHIVKVYLEKTTFKKNLLSCFLVSHFITLPRIKRHSHKQIFIISQ